MVVCYNFSNKTTMRQSAKFDGYAISKQTLLPYDGTSSHVTSVMTLVILGEQEASWLLPYAHPWHATVSCIADIGYPCMDSATTANTIRAAAIAHNIIRQWSGLVKDLDASIIIMDVPQTPGIDKTRPDLVNKHTDGNIKNSTQTRSGIDQRQDVSQELRQEQE